jgi:hypothetical protein
MRNRVTLLAAATVMATIGGPACAELGSDNPTDDQLTQQRVQETTAVPGRDPNSGIFDILAPPPGRPLQPVERIPRGQFGVVGPVPLTMDDLGALLYPSASASTSVRTQVLEGLTFFTTPHTAAEGLGPINNQVFCLGCHENAAEGVRGLVSAVSCFPGSTCVSHVTRAARSSPTNFVFTSLNPRTGGGRPANNLDAVYNTGKTAAFTVFGDFMPSAPTPTGIGFFDPLDGNPTHGPNGGPSQPFGGPVQRTRPAGPQCFPDPIAPVGQDANLRPPTQFRRAVGELAGPPYIGRGLIEAVPTADITAMADPDGTTKPRHRSTLGHFAAELGCNTDCITGRANMIPPTFQYNKDPNGNVTSVTGFVGGLGRFGLRANGTEILQFIIGGLQGELSLTSLINPSEIPFPTLFPSTKPLVLRVAFGAGSTASTPTITPTPEPAACINAVSTSPEVHLSTPFSERNLLRNTAPPEFGDALLALLKSTDPTQPPVQYEEALVQRGAELFGIDLKAFANRMIKDRMPQGGDDGLDPHAINQTDRKLDCVGCHTPVQRTGKSPAEMGSVRSVSFRWAPIFSDLLIHKMPVIDAERFSPRPRDPAVIFRFPRAEPQGFDTFDLTRNLAQDSFTNQKALADGREFRTAPLMGLGRIGPPFLHDARVYLSGLTVNNKPAGTVTTNSKQTNAPLVVRTVDDALLAAIELHDLPAPDDGKTPVVQPGAGCPAPDGTNVDYGPSPDGVICPPYASATSQTNRSDSREVILRFRKLSPEDQQALIEFLKQL